MDLSPGQQAVQAAHALAEFCITYPVLASEWHSASNYLALLSVKDEMALTRLLSEVNCRGLKVVPFHEPDLGNSLTAIAIEPGREARRLCSGLPLALRDKPCLPAANSNS